MADILRFDGSKKPKPKHVDTPAQRWARSVPRPPIKASPAQFAGRRPTPDRITTALDLRGLYGPEVDEACGVEEPAVDEWETGQRIPTFEQIEKLSDLTGFPVAFFYKPPLPEASSAIVCGSDGCHSVRRDGGVCPHCGKSI